MENKATSENDLSQNQITLEIGYDWKAATPNLNLALSKARGEFPSIPKTKTAHVRMRDNKGEYSFKFADLSDIMDAVKDSLAKFEIAVTHTIALGRSGLVLETSVRHSSGEMIRSLVPMPFMDGRPQDWGSMLTYLRRYVVSAMLGIASDEDDDGNAAQGNNRSIQDSKKKVEPKPKPQPESNGPKPKFVPASFEDLNDLSSILASREISFEVVQAAVKTAYNFTLKKDDPEIPKTIVDEVREYLYSADATGGGLEAWAKEKAGKRAQPRSIRTPVDPGDYVLEIGSLAGKRLSEIDDDALKIILEWTEGEKAKTPPRKDIAVILDTDLKIKAFLKSKENATK